jgi:hypothetical protein
MTRLVLPLKPGDLDIKDISRVIRIQPVAMAMERLIPGLLIQLKGQ